MGRRAPVPGSYQETPTSCPAPLCDAGMGSELGWGGLWGSWAPLATCSILQRGGPECWVAPTGKQISVSSAHLQYLRQMGLWAYCSGDLPHDFCMVQKAGRCPTRRGQSSKEQRVPTNAAAPQLATALCATTSHCVVPGCFCPMSGPFPFIPCSWNVSVETTWLRRDLEQKGTPRDGERAPSRPEGSVIFSVTLFTLSLCSALPILLPPLEK